MLVTKRRPTDVSENRFHALLSQNFGVGQFTWRLFCAGEDGTLCCRQKPPLSGFSLVFLEERVVPSIYLFQCEVFRALANAWPATLRHSGNRKLADYLPEAIVQLITCRLLKRAKQNVSRYTLALSNVVLDLLDQIDG